MTTIEKKTVGDVSDKLKEISITLKALAEQHDSSAPSKPVAVDLGLPSGTLWCDRNVGATAPQDYGAFFSWGNTKPHYPRLDITTWGYIENAFDTSFDEDVYVDTEGCKLKGNIDLAHDAARVNMGEPWRMPSDKEYQELYANCDWVRMTIGGVNGYLVTSKLNGNHIFFPASGGGSGTSWGNRGALGLYWSSSCYSARLAGPLVFTPSGVNPRSNYNRYYGFAVRPVQNLPAKE